MYRKDKGHVPVLVMKVGEEGVVVRRDEVSGYVNDPQFNYLLSVYQYVKLWGMPNGNGWANEPTDVLDGITALEIEAKTIESEAYNKDNKTTSGKSLGVRTASA